MGRVKKDMGIGITIKGSLLMVCLKDMVSMNGWMAVHIKVILSRARDRGMAYGRPV